MSAATEAELQELRERLAAAEAVIAALPKCEKCKRLAVNECEYFGRITMRCDAHICSPSPLHPIESPLRAYIALTEGK